MPGDYVDIFGGSPIQPSLLMYSRLDLSAANDGLTLKWPGFELPGEVSVARVFELTSDQADRFFIMPSALEVAEGQDVMFVNRGAFQIIAKKHNLDSVVVIGAGEAKYLYLTDSSTEQGSWGIIAIGATVSFANASLLAGSGLLAYLGRLVTALPNQAVDASFSATINDRAKIFVFTGGNQTLTLPSAATVADQFFLGARNSGTGTITISRAGTDTIDGQTTIQLNPDESTFVFSNGQQWYTIGRGRSAEFNFTQLIKSVAGNADVTLTTVESQNKLITFTGQLTGNISTIFPGTVNVYYLFNDTTGAFTITARTAGGTGFVVPQGQRVIVFVDGTDVYAAQTATPGSAILFADGTQAAPAIAFSADADLGFYRFGANEIAAVANNTILWRLNTVRLLLGVPLNFTSTAVRDATVTALGIAPSDTFLLGLAIEGGL